MNIYSDYKKITLTGTETEIKFPRNYPVFGVKGENITVALTAGAVSNTRSTADTDGVVMWAHKENIDTMYLTGTGDVIVWAGDRPEECPFKIGGKGGGSDGSTHYKGTTTTALENGSTTNPITINGESYTAVFGDVVVYNYTEFVFDGTTWGEFGRPFDTIPTQNSANAVTSDGIYTSLSGKQNIMQYAVMPTVTQDMVGQVAQYIGETTASYTHGYFYTATSDGWMNTPAAGKTYYSETVLWENASHSATPIGTTISLYDSFKNYDAVAGIIEYNENNSYISCNIIPTSQLASNIIWTNNFDIGSTDNSFVSIAIIGDTSIKITSVSMQYTSHLQKFIGIKYNDQIAHDLG